MIRIPEQNNYLELEDFIFSIHNEIDILYHKVKLEKWIEYICGMPSSTFSNFTFGVDYASSTSKAFSKFYSDVSIPVIKPGVHHIVYNSAS